MKLGSFFDGIGGWLLAAKHAGVKPVWASEIDDFPAAVTAHHFPQVKQLGDITKINVDELEPTDIICAGSPCQDLSVAGKRKGLEGERSGLFVDAIKLVHGLRERTGKPRYFVWENVPGAFSSNKGFDFAAVLSEITKAEIPIPKDNKWADSGMVEWDGGSLAWRVLDAQGWGVPQRRRRIFLVADFDGRSAGEILFVEQGLHGDSSESERERKEVATDVRASTDIAVYDMTHADEVMRPVTGDKSNCLNSRMGTGGNQVPVIHTIAGNIIGRANQNGGHQLGIGQDVEQNKVVYPAGKVRRLTPIECERLQGLPDSYTDIEFNGKPAPDSRRYKALGNGMAQPCADYVIRRIQEVNDNGQT